MIDNCSATPNMTEHEADLAGGTIDCLSLTKRSMYDTDSDEESFGQGRRLQRSLAWSFDDSVDETSVAGGDIISSLWCIMTPLLVPAMPNVENPCVAVQKVLLPARIEDDDKSSTWAE